MLAFVQWHDVHDVSQQRAITLTAESEGVAFAFTVVPSRRMKLLDAAGAVLAAESGGTCPFGFVASASVSLPSVECGTVGGGTSLPAQAAALRLMGRSSVSDVSESRL